MFDFEKIKVYSKTKQFNRVVTLFLKHIKVSKNKKVQLEKMVLNVMLNITEASGRFTKPDKRNFYIIARQFLFCIIGNKYSKLIYENF